MSVCVFEYVSIRIRIRGGGAGEGLGQNRCGEMRVLLRVENRSEIVLGTGSGNEAVQFQKRVEAVFIIYEAGPVPRQGRSVHEDRMGCRPVVRARLARSLIRVRTEHGGASV